MVKAESQVVRETSVARQISSTQATAQRALVKEAIPHRAREVDQEQHRERAEGSEGGEHRVGDHLVAQGEQRRHDQGGPSRSPKRDVPGSCSRGQDRAVDIIGADSPPNTFPLDVTSRQVVTLTSGSVEEPAVTLLLGAPLRSRRPR